MKLNLNSLIIIIILLLLAGCGASKTDQTPQEIQQIEDYTIYASNTENFELEIREFNEESNEDGSEYCIFFTDDEENLVRTKYMTDVGDLNVVIDYYFKDGELLLLSFRDKATKEYYHQYMKNGEKISECCDIEPEKSLIKNGMQYTEQYLATR